MADEMRHTMVLQWSDEDDAYLVSFPEWEGVVFNPFAHGDTYTAAVRNGEEALEGLAASLTKQGEPPPKRRPVLTADSQ